MTEHDDVGGRAPATWAGTIQSLAEGGIPQLLAGPAGKALSRLIGASVEIPAAWFEQKAQSIRDETEARSKVMQTLAEKSAELGLADPKLLDRGLNNLLSRAYREQANHEAVAYKVAEQLRIDPPPLDSPGPSDDWLNVFEEYAAKASSEWVRENWARVLAGEIRKPNSFSLQTLAFLSQLDQSSAIAVNAALSRAVNGDYVIIGEIWGQDFQNMIMARSLGVILQVDSDMTIKRAFDEDGLIAFDQNGTALIAHGTPGQTIALRVNALSRVGRELHPVLNPGPDEDATTRLIGMLKSDEHVKSIERGKGVRTNQEIWVTEISPVWVRDGA